MKRTFKPKKTSRSLSRLVKSGMTVFREAEMRGVAFQEKAPWQTSAMGGPYRRWEK